MDILDQITASVATASDRTSEEFRALGKRDGLLLERRGRSIT